MSVLGTDRYRRMPLGKILGGKAGEIRRGGTGIVGESCTGGVLGEWQVRARFLAYIR